MYPIVKDDGEGRIFQNLLDLAGHQNPLLFRFWAVPSGFRASISKLRDHSFLDRWHV